MLPGAKTTAPHHKSVWQNLITAVVGTFVDGDGSTGINRATGNATYPTMAVLSTKLYLAWSEANADNRTQIRVKII